MSLGNAIGAVSGRAVGGEQMGEHTGDPGDVWLITGCSSGLGAAIARAAAARRATVVATARDASSIPAPSDGGSDRLVRLALDVTDPAQRAAVVAHVVERFGRIDVLVNNAGSMFLGAVEECTDEDRRAMFDLHVFAPTELVRLVLPHMRGRGGGTIVQMSSKGAFLTAPATSCYTASKAALEAISTALAEEVAAFGIRVMIVEPGQFRTAVFAGPRLRAAPPMSAYDGVVGPIRRHFRASDGAQAGDPERAAEIIVEVARGATVPMRLPLGADAVDDIRAAVRAIDAQMVDGAELARATTYGDRSLGSPPPSDSMPGLVAGVDTPPGVG
jgi:NAD(P)-dependent dehydrogenase (short-subunit alcohol dehydrogenase family)